MKYKVVVIGSGPAGYTAAIRAAQLGAKVAIVERDLIGGICTNWGCTPSKAMITSAKYAKYASEAAHYGIELGGVKVNFAKVASRRDEVMKRSRLEIRHALDKAGVEVIGGSAQIVNPNLVRVSKYVNPNADLTDADGNSPYDSTDLQQERDLETENIIIATGSEPTQPPFVKGFDESIINSNKLIWIKDLPKELTIIGGGIIGLEFSALFSHFGTKVRIVEYLDRCIANMDPEISAQIESSLREQGIEILTGHKVLEIGNGKIKAERMSDGSVIDITSPLNLIAIGRKAVIHSPELEALGMKFSPKGIEVDSNLKTNIDGIYAVGDATGISILAHVAIQQGIIAAENIMGMKRDMNYDVVPAVVYTLPEVASVGTVPQDLSDVKTVKFPFAANLKANIEEHNDGFVKLWIKGDKLLAAQLIGDHVGEIVQGYANVIATGATLSEIAQIIHAHPTYNEIVRNSFEFALGKAIEYKP